MAKSRWHYWRRFNLPHVIYLLVLIALAAVSYWWVRMDAKEIKVVQKSPTGQMDGFAENAQLSQISGNGKTMFQASMDHITHFGNQNISGQNLILTATGDQQPKVVVKAQKAVWDSKGKAIELTGDVWLMREADARNPKTQAMQLHTEQMRVDMKQALASSDAPFELKQGLSTVIGQRFKYDYQLRDLDMGVGASGQANATQGARIKAQILNARPQ